MGLPSLSRLAMAFLGCVRSKQPSIRIGAFATSRSLAYLGGGATALAMRWDPLVLVATLLWPAGLVATACALTARRMDDYDTITEIAMLSTFLLGVMAFADRPREAMALAALMAWILGAKPERSAGCSVMSCSRPCGFCSSQW